MALIDEEISNVLDNIDNDPNYIPLDESSSDESHQCVNVGSTLNVDVDNQNDKRTNTENKTIGDTDNPEQKIRGRKRVRNPVEWKRNKNRVKRYRGESYTNRSGKLIEAKQFKNYDCKCSKNCYQNVTQEERKNLFDSFMALADNTKQNIYVRGLVQSAQVKQRRSRDSSREPKSKTYKYFLNTNTSSVQVCKKFFLETFQVSDARLYKCCSESDVTAAIDGRGHRSPGNKLDISGVINHIKSFPCYKSHYTRADNPSRRYLSSSLNIRKMYTLYVEKCTQEETQPVKEKKYYEVFSKNFNLHFKPPAKDTCQKCDSLENKIKFAESEEVRKEAVIEKEVHLRKAELARSSMNNDKIRADLNLYVFTIDLQKALAFPKLSCSVAYYKTNMYIYNFGCHSFNTNTATMYMWDETQGSRGSQDLGSCVVSHLRKNAANHKSIVMYSDSCTGQNRNIKMSLLLLQLVNDSTMSAQNIDHKFLISGHSYLPNDSDFAIIENKAKKCEYIFGPEDWYKIVTTAKKSKPFEVIKVKNTEFVSTKNLEDAIQNRKTDTDGAPVNWLKIQWLRFYKGQPNKIYFKFTLDEDMPFSVIDVKKSCKVGKPLNFSNIPKQKLYSDVRPVTQKKKKDMLDLLPFIPPMYHQYYRTIKVVSDYSNTRATSSQNTVVPPTQKEARNSNSDDSDYID